MGIPIGGGRRGRRRRSYADYNTRRRRNTPSSDPFRVVFYLILIAAGIWANFNLDTIKAMLDLPISEGRTLIAGVGDDSPAGVEIEAEVIPDASAEELAAQGEEAYLDGNLVEAILYYKEAAVLAPNTVEYHVQTARLLLFQSAMEYGEQNRATLEEAIAAANGAILANPESPQGYAIMGKVMDWNGDPERALSEIARALEIDPNYAVAQSYKAEALMDLNRWDQATQTAEAALALEPDNIDIRRDYAYVLESLGYYPDAVTQYEAALRLHPKLPYLNMSLGRAYRQVGRYQEAIDQFFIVETLDPTNVLIPFEIGRTYETYVGDPNAALEYYERAVEVDDSYSFPWVRIGAIRYIQGSYVQAIPALERALALGNERVSIYYQLGLSYAYEQDCQSAVPYLVEAEQRSEGDEAILDIVESGYALCPAEVLALTPSSAPADDDN